MKKGFNIKCMQTGSRVAREFFTRDVLDVAPELIGKNLVIRLHDDSFLSHRITEVEAYRGREDLACHASKGKTPRTEVMFREGGHLYVYLIYGMYWMLNIVTSTEGVPQAVLIRGLAGIPGPGKVSRTLGIDRSYYGEDLVRSGRIWLEDSGDMPDYKTGPRIGIDYAGEYWKSRPWRYYL
jgi:DNA-3-methyladenine glycosylase